MSRKPLPAAEVIDVQVNQAELQKDSDTANALALMSEQNTNAAKEVALQVGYDGSLAVGALEDEIRFYQRQTVQAILETGKRLLVLKELTPHGEFEQRVDLLGFSVRTARRFMQSAVKTAKSAKLADLSTQAKNGSAFLELITHDDDTIEAISQMDDFDKMSASQVRDAARELEAQLTVEKQKRDKADDQVTKLQLQLKKKVVADTDWPDALDPLSEQIAAAGRKIAQGLSELETCRIKAFDVGSEIPEGDSAQRAKFEAALAHVAGVYADALKGADKVLGAELAAFDSTLGGFLAE